LTAASFGDIFDDGGAHETERSEISVLVRAGVGCAASRPSSEVKFGCDAGSVDIVELTLMLGGDDV
jgi:hypothetical protein